MAIETNTEMSTQTYPPITNGTSVRTTKENPALSKEWTEDAKVERKWGVTGTVIAYHDSHGLCYDIQHSDGSKGCYDPSEFEVLPTKQAIKRRRAIKKADLMGLI